MMLEPAADARIAARQIRELYVAFTEVGFTEDQALDLVIALLPSPRKDNK